jgi:hypothetical protein
MIEKAIREKYNEIQNTISFYNELVPGSGEFMYDWLNALYENVKTKRSDSVEINCECISWLIKHPENIFDGDKYYVNQCLLNHETFMINENAQILIDYLKTYQGIDMSFQTLSEKYEYGISYTYQRFFVNLKILPTQSEQLSQWGETAREARKKAQ